MAIACLGYVMIYFGVNVGFGVLKSERKFRKRMNELRES
jgi:hypothetical protein